MNTNWSPLFPQNKNPDGTFPHEYGLGGAGLLEYFTGQALQGLLARSERGFEEGALADRAVLLSALCDDLAADVRPRVSRKASATKVIKCEHGRS